MKKFIIKNHMFLLSIIRKFAVFMVLLRQSRKILITPMSWMVLLVQTLMMLQMLHILRMILSNLTYLIQDVGILWILNRLTS
jgi:hypothetical protein